MSRKCFYFICVMIFTGHVTRAGAQQNETSEPKETPAVSEVGAAAANATDTEVQQVKKVPFSWKVKPTDAVVRINETVYADCVAQKEGTGQGQPPVYQWVQQNGDVIPTANVSTSANLDIWMYENGTLVIKSFTKDFQGKYTCTIGSNVLQETISVRSGKPVVLGDLPEKLQLFYGCNLTIVCAAVGDGTVKGSWLHGDEMKEVVSDDRRFTRDQSQNNTFQWILHIFELEEKDGGLYTCKASNTFDSTNTVTIKVELSKRPENASCPAGVIVASAPQHLTEESSLDETDKDPEKNVVLVYIVPAVIVGTLLLIAIVVAVALIVRKRRQQQNAVFSGVKYRRTEGNEESIRA